MLDRVCNTVASCTVQQLGKCAKVNAWPHAGMYQHICACKEVVAEPSNVSGEVFDEAIKGYR